MRRIAIIEDEKAAAESIQKLVRDYGEAQGNQFLCSWFPDAESFLESFKAEYDLIFLDIKLPGMNGMQAAEEVRTKDRKVLIVFVTNMRQYAIKGYVVDALDFIVKPVEAMVLNTLLDKAMRILIPREDDAFIVIRTPKGYHRIYIHDLLYVDVQKHKITYHLTEGVVESWGNLSEAEKLLPMDQFSRCHNCYLVNLRYVVSIEGDDVIVGKDTLKIARTRKKDFFHSFTNYLGEVGGMTNVSL